MLSLRINHCSMKIPFHKAVKILIVELTAWHGYSSADDMLMKQPCRFAGMLVPTIKVIINSSSSYYYQASV